MKLTIGMAVYDDFNGVYFTIQSLRMYHDCSQVEFLVIDNKPDSPQGELTRRFVESWPRHASAGARYVALPQPVGTTVPRDEVFRQATGDIVLCIDSHVLLKPIAISRLISFYEQHPDCDDLICGPMLMDDLSTCLTHFDDTWRGEMWGTWSSAWQCKCRSKDGMRFSVSPGPGPTATSVMAAYRAVSMGNVAVKECQHCGQSLPSAPYPGHERVLETLGYKRLGIDDHDEPFEVPGQGLGLFGCRRDAWLGFNRNFRGFGGEEMYIHEKYRQAGRKVVCLPFLKWGHRFGRPTVPYPLTRWNKVRNYVLGHQELGLPLERVREHFHEKLFSQQDWEHLLAEPHNHIDPPAKPECATCPQLSASGLPQPPQAVLSSAKALLAWCKSQPRGFESHLDKLAELAAQCDHVTEFSKKRESLVGLLSAKKVVSFNLEASETLVQSIARHHQHVTVTAASPVQVDKIAPTDLLFIDSTYTAKGLTEELRKFAPSVSRFIVLPHTRTNGERGDDQGPGLLAALRQFMKQQPEWSVIHHSQDQNGLTVIGCDARDKPELPSTITMASNFAKAMTAYVADGARGVDTDVLRSRLEQCTLCEHRWDDRCSVCGCFLEAKAKQRVSTCPLGKWAA